MKLDLADTVDGWLYLEEFEKQNKEVFCLQW